MIIIGAIILQKTRFGRNVYAIGGNEQSAKLMGLPVARTKVLVYGFNGLCSVLAGVAYVLYVKSGWNLALQGGGAGRHLRHRHRRHAAHRRRRLHVRHALRRAA